jgi:hypothetical protein
LVGFCVWLWLRILFVSFGGCPFPVIVALEVSVVTNNGTNSNNGDDDDDDNSSSNNNNNNNNNNNTGFVS